MSKERGNRSQRPDQPPHAAEGHSRYRSLARRGENPVSVRTADRACIRPRSEESDPRLYRTDGRLSAGDRQGERHLRQIRHARRRSVQAGLMGRDPRQHGARLGKQRHRRRAYPDADAVSDLRRQGDAEQRADADVHPGAAQSRCAGDLGRQRIQGSEGHHRRFGAEGRLREKESRRQGSEDRDDLPGRHARSLDSLLGCRRRHRSRQGRLHHRGSAAADGGEHEGRQHGRLLRRRAVGRTTRQSEYRLLRVLAPAKSGASIRRRRSACAPPGSTNIRMPPRRC